MRIMRNKPIHFYGDFEFMGEFYNADANYYSKSRKIVREDPINPFNKPIKYKDRNFMFGKKIYRVRYCFVGSQLQILEYWPCRKYRKAPKKLR